jgi:LysM repeat protein
MKTIKKKPSRARSRKKTHHEEDIFNPFAPLISAVQNWFNRPRRESGSFRNAFITVFLLHVLAVLGFMTFGAFRNATTQPTAKTKGNTQPGHVAKVLQSTGPELVSQTYAQPGGKLVPVREADPFAVASDKKNPNKTASADITKPKEIDRKLAAPIPTNKAMATSNQQVTDTSRQESAKQAFLQATGRVPSQHGDSSEVAMGQMLNEPVETPNITNSETAGVESYVVQSGDNIFTISRKMNVTFTELASANNLSGPSDVRVGQTLVRPPTNQM